ncbi:hypothetical protein [Clostridium lacusfryxellense]|uniref:hypothetical protein n=1 Tax=Clostridium lacusfryxellense TaxID=205328 RepID=UPI001C0C413B|nr:hypothetical protein [Clostridium lacusfryxellense]MBU3110238.1 hypothetical protein [Clostridium lacusfryxellense]
MKRRIFKFIVIGYGTDVTKDEEKSFKEVIIANAINFSFDNHKSYVVKDISEVKTILENL